MRLLNRSFGLGRPQSRTGERDTGSVIGYSPSAFPPKAYGEKMPWQVFWLASRWLLPILLNSGPLSTPFFEAYSSGDCSGFSPDSLLNSLDFQGNTKVVKIGFVNLKQSNLCDTLKVNHLKQRFSHLRHHNNEALGRHLQLAL